MNIWIKTLGNLWKTQGDIHEVLEHCRDSQQSVDIPRTQALQEQLRLPG